jgi:hypothetical protein
VLLLFGFDILQDERSARESEEKGRERDERTGERQLWEWRKCLFKIQYSLKGEEKEKNERKKKKEARRHTEKLSMRRGRRERERKKVKSARALPATESANVTGQSQGGKDFWNGRMILSV